MGEFHTKVVGVTHPNSDGSSRQATISRCCRPGMPLIFKPEPSNPADPNAVGVWVEIRCMLFFRRAVQIGYISRDLADEFSEAIAAGERIDGWISDVTGGTREKPTFGVNLLINKE
jgi:hypothetical protein